MDKAYLMILILYQVTSHMIDVPVTPMSRDIVNLEVDLRDVYTNGNQSKVPTATC